MYLATCQCQRQEVQGLLCRKLVIHWEVDKRWKQNIGLFEGIPVDGFYDIGTFLQSRSQIFIAAFLADLGRVNDEMKEIIWVYRPRSFSARTAACARDTSTDRSPFPIRSFPSKLRTMYLASKSWHVAKSFVMMETFFAWDLFANV